ncbi:MAG: hypothetical protein Q9195_007964 [Heterodermia aff. obscurata]
MEGWSPSDDYEWMVKVDVSLRPEDGKTTADAFEETRRTLDDEIYKPPCVPQYASDQVLESSPIMNTGRLLELPMIINNRTRVAARPDSGSEENIILAEFVDTLGIGIDSRPESQREFRIANGKVVKATGHVVINCSFEKDPLIKLPCLFFVFKKLISPIIMGMAFLAETETLNKHRYRLQPRSTPARTRFQLCSLDSPRQQLHCLADGRAVLANADTGSEIDLLSKSYVKKRGFDVNSVEPSSSEVQFADGTISRLIGKTHISIAFGRNIDTTYMMEFHILDGLTCDILLGERFLNQVSAFETYQDAFTSVPNDEDLGEVNTIRWLNSLELGIHQLINKRNVQASPQAQNGDLRKTLTDQVKKRIKNPFNPNAQHEGATNIGAAGTKRAPSISSDEEDARENYRREKAECNISKLPSFEKTSAYVEEQEKINMFEQSKKDKLPSPRDRRCSSDGQSLPSLAHLAVPMDVQSPAQEVAPSPASTFDTAYSNPNSPLAPFPGPSKLGEFRCEHPGCTAPPFQTQYLLK